MRKVTQHKDLLCTRGFLSHFYASQKEENVGQAGLILTKRRKEKAALYFWGATFALRLKLSAHIYRILRNRVQKLSSDVCLGQQKKCISLLIITRRRRASDENQEREGRKKFHTNQEISIWEHHIKLYWCPTFPQRILFCNIHKFLPFSKNLSTCSKLSTLCMNTYMNTLLRFGSFMQAWYGFNTHIFYGKQQVGTLPKLRFFLHFYLWLQAFLRTFLKEPKKYQMRDVSK